MTDLTPSMGSEVRGVQLSSLGGSAKDELALYVARRKVVAFRDQDFADLPIAAALAFGAHFGRHHVHPTSGMPDGHPEIQLVHRGEGDGGGAELLRFRTSSVAWHSDVSYELQPPGTTLLYVLDEPDSGGDTLFVDAAQAYRRLSPLFRQHLHGLTATHSGVEQVNAAAARASIKRREPVVHEHPVVRTHPATGEKALFVNAQCTSCLVHLPPRQTTAASPGIDRGPADARSRDKVTREIVGMKVESDALLQFLYGHMALGADFQARIKWEERTVVIWDNRVTQHSALVDWDNGQRRHLARITPQAERPYETPFEG